jgi:nitroreductase
MTETTMSAHEALATRRSVRRFLDRPVARDSVHHILRGAAQSPSGHNIQPWKVYVVSGVTKQKVTDSVLHAVANDPEEMHQPEFEYYPSEWFEPYLGRRREVGSGLYECLGIARDDHEARTRQMNENFHFFGAPVGMFITFDRRLATGTFMDIGMFLQSIFIGARAEGLDTCGQAIFTWYHRVIRRHLPMGDNELLACGMSLGFADQYAPENGLIASKLSVESFTTFLD